MNRRRFLRIPLLAAPLAALPVGAYAHYLEPEWLEVDRQPVRLPGIKTAGIQLGKTIRIAQLSDFHSSDVVPNALIERSIDVALAQKPDVVCLTGDFITHEKKWFPDWYVPVLQRVQAQALCVAVLGNHDLGWASEPSQKHGVLVSAIELLQAANIPLLQNRWMELTVRGQRLRIVGTGDLWSGWCAPELAFQGIPQDDVPQVVLTHNPDAKELMADFRWDLMLAGHTHGGQVVMPVLDFSPAPVKDKRYIKGLKPWNDRQIYVSAGVGNLDGVRFNCRPQVSVLDLHG
ncbi:phosphodiesterase YaeI [Nevskia soli]|uniref:phosphodiesterase YaeI n=1 Tax=Nevskia soli TaxID=418856 RepID=UPI0015D8A2C4|nr:phosphodiesterase YaeI [Nevskia soli]